MKKTPDITKSVMDRVVRFEKKDTDAWRRRFIILTAVLSIIIFIIVWAIVRALSEEQSWSLLTLFNQDPEIISSYWKDTVWVFWQGVPQVYVYLGTAVLCILVGLWLLTRKKRKIIGAKRRQLDKYV